LLTVAQSPKSASTRMRLTASSSVRLTVVGEWDGAVLKPRPHHLRDAARIVAVRLVDLRLQHRLHVPCAQARSSRGPHSPRSTQNVLRECARPVSSTRRSLPSPHVCIPHSPATRQWFATQTRVGMFYCMGSLRLTHVILCGLCTGCRRFPGEPSPRNHRDIIYPGQGRPLTEPCRSLTSFTKQRFVSRSMRRVVLLHWRRNSE
jgi:hypothetical protein